MKYYIKKESIIFLVITLITIGWLLIYNSNTQASNAEEEIEKVDSCKLWVDSVFNALTPDDRIAQLFMIKACLNKDQAHYDAVANLIAGCNVGGICFFETEPVQQAKLTNYLQSLVRTPLLVAIDAEWGLAMRMDSIYPFPRQMTLGAIQNDTLVYEMADEIARQCKRLGIHINFAPVVDVNSNPANPVINSRSFGENKYNVSRKGLAYMNGLQDNRIIACAKHFPGHGDTDQDSHLTLPIVNNSKEIIDSVHLYPFKQLIQHGVKSIMVGHLFVPAYDTTRNTATTLSKIVVTDLLKKQMGFTGLIITDALEMKGVSNHYKPGELEVKALIAGNDILLMPTDVNIAINEIKNALDSGLITQDEIDAKCRKVLTNKYWVGLNKYKPIKIENLYEDLNNSMPQNIAENLFESAVTLLKNNKNIIPLRELDTLKIASVSIGNKINGEFRKALNTFIDVDEYSLIKQPSSKEVDSLITKLSKYNLVIIGIHNTNNLASGNYGITQSTIDFIGLLSKKVKVIIDVFANPYCLSQFQCIDNAEALLVSYQNNVVAERLSAHIITGDIEAKGKLPVTASYQFPVNTGIETKIGKRLIVSSPEKTGVNVIRLKKIDSIALAGIAEGAYPGCQILAAKDGKIFYYKSFGYHTYGDTIPVENTDLYDLASITKVTATTLAMMKLYEEGKIDLDEKLVTYLPYLKGTNKANIIIRDLMTHQAKLKEWIPFYLKTIDKTTGKLDTNIYNKVKSDKFPYRVADSIYIHKSYRDTILKQIIESELYKKKEYRYSDLGFYLLREVIEAVSFKSFEDYLNENFYEPLDLSTMCFNPRNHYDLSRIVPTEKDDKYRKQLVHGDVHDQGAAMLGGVSGHAGLFSDVMDVAIIMQMLLQNGEYDGHTYFKASTIKEFTKYQFPDENNRRGLGFDKPFVIDKGGPACNEASKNSFGHSGFTGTCVWADPDEKLIYVFLSNRIHPDPDNKKLIDLNIRTSIQQVIYQAVK